MMSMNNLVGVLSGQGEYEQAEEMHRQVFGGSLEGSKWKSEEQKRFGIDVGRAEKGLASDRKPT